MHLYFYFLEYMEENKFDTLWGRGIFTIKSMSCCQMFRNKCVSITANGLDRNGYELVRGMSNITHTYTYFHYCYLTPLFASPPVLPFKRHLPLAIILFEAVVSVLFKMNLIFRLRVHSPNISSSYKFIKFL